MSRSFFFFSSRRRHTRFDCDWSSDVCSSDLILHGDIVLGKDLCLRDAVRIGILALLRSATAALAYVLWGRSALPRSQHSLHRCADVAASTQPRDEEIRGTSSLVLVWGKCCPAVAGRCLEHHEASRSTASSRRMISAIQHKSFAERYH